MRAESWSTAYPTVIITWAHYLGPPGSSISQILRTFSRFSEDCLGRERERERERQIRIFLGGKMVLDV